jgi:hypothetical protein
MSAANDLQVVEEAIGVLEDSLDAARTALRTIVDRGGHATVAGLAEIALELLHKARNGYPSGPVGGFSTPSDSGTFLTGSSKRSAPRWKRRPLVQPYTRCPMSKHTPGPWGFVALRNGARIEADGRAVAWIGASDTVEMPSGRIAKRVTTEDKANTRLIAAAPDLLEALKDVADYLENNRMDTRERNLASAARAAIAKAEGRHG